MAIEKRNCLYNITIHLNDTIKSHNDYVTIDYDKLKYQLQELLHPSTEAYFIMHDKDINEDGTLKDKHIHLAIQFKYNCGKTFSAMKSILPQSHIEQCINFTNAVLYLTHETQQAIKEGKYKYDRSEVVNVYDSDIQKHYNAYTKELFDWEKIEQYITIDHTLTLLDFGRRFGYNVIHNKWNVICVIINELHNEGKI